jgi:hypothetical protein
MSDVTFKRGIWVSGSLCSRQLPQAVLHGIIIALPKAGFPRNSFDCVSARAVRSVALGFGIIAMLEAVTAFFGFVSAGIFLAHAVDGYRSR